MSDTESSASSSERENTVEDKAETFATKIGKRLAYVLRYGAQKEGIQVSDEGYVSLQDVMKVPIFKHNTGEEVLKICDQVLANGQRRFEKQYKNGSVYIRALYGRRMERNPYHEGTKVCRLMECCLNYLTSNIHDYDLQDFPDDYLLFTMMHKLKRQNRLNNKSLVSFLGPNIERLDLGGMMVTAGTIKLIGERCTHLREVNLRETSYLLNDHIMENFLKKLPKLQVLNLSGCIHQTDRTIDALIKHCPAITQVNLSHIPNISQEGVLRLLAARPNLTHLDIYDNKNITEEGREVLLGYCKQRDLAIILEGLDIDKECASKVAQSLKLASVGKYW